MLRILFAIIFVVILTTPSQAEVCSIAQNINSPEQCELSGDSHCCQWGYWFQSFYCVETWCYSYNTCSFKFNFLKLAAILLRLLPISVSDWCYKNLRNL